MRDTFATDATLVGLIADWLEAERRSVVSHLTAAGIPLGVDASVPVVTKLTESGLEMTTAIKKQNVLGVGGALAWRALADRTPEPSPAAEVHRTYGNRCWYQQGRGQPDFATEPVEWVDQRLLQPTSWTFLHSLGDLAQTDRDLALRVAADLVDFVKGDVVSLRTELPLGGLRLSGVLDVRDFRLRPLRPSEIAALEDFPISGQPGVEEFSRVRRLHARSGERAMLEMTEHQPKREWRQPTTKLQCVVLSLQLIGFRVWGAGLAIRREYPIPAGSTGSTVPLAARGEWRPVSLDEFNDAVMQASHIPDEVFANPTSASAIALSRYSSALADRTDTDALIDLTIALEAVLLPRESEGELKFRLALFGSHFVGTDANERTDLFAKFCRIYDTRSDIVHGKHVDAAELQRVTAMARELVSRVLRRGLERGWPKQDDLRESVLRGN